MLSNHFWQEFWRQFAAGVVLALLTVAVTYISRRKLRRAVERHLCLLRQ